MRLSWLPELPELLYPELTSGGHLPLAPAIRKFNLAFAFAAAFFAVHWRRITHTQRWPQEIHFMSVHSFHERQITMDSARIQIQIYFFASSLSILMSIPLPLYLSLFSFKL